MGRHRLRLRPAPRRQRHGPARLARRRRHRPRRSPQERVERRPLRRRPFLFRRPRHRSRLEQHQRTPTISNFDTAFFYSPETDVQGYAGTHLIDNVINVPSDNADLGQNGGILLGPGANQTIQGNKIYLAGNGGSSNSSFGISSFTFAGNAWNNLLIDNNTITVTTAGANEKILGIGENSGSVGSNISVTNNTFIGTDGDDPANQQIAFGITSESVAATATNPAATVTYTGNAVHGASEGFVWGDPEASPAYDFTDSKYLPIAFSNTTLTDVNVGFVARDGGKATIASTTIANSGMFLFGTAFHADGAGSVITVADPTTNCTGVQNLKNETNGGLVIFLSISGGIADVSKAEGNVGVTMFSFPVVLDVAPAANQVFTVDYATSSGTADGNDYNSAGPAATLTFGPGAETSATITVRVFGDFTPGGRRDLLRQPLEPDPHHQRRRRARPPEPHASDRRHRERRHDVAVGQHRWRQPWRRQLGHHAIHVPGDSECSSRRRPVLHRRLPDVARRHRRRLRRRQRFPGGRRHADLPGRIDDADQDRSRSVVVFGDTKVEPNETFNVTLSKPQLHFTTAPQSIPGNLGTSTATGTILNDDTNAPVVSINSVLEGGGGRRSPATRRRCSRRSRSRSA